MDCTDPSLANSPECASRPIVRSQAPSGPEQNTVYPQMPPAYRDDEEYGRLNRTMPAERILPPEPLTEFQKFTAAATGRILPIFGSELFARVPSTFAPVDLAPIPDSYVIGPGDELRIRVWGQVTFQANVRVDRSGDIYLPRIGVVHVAGVAYADLQNRVREAVGRQFKNFELSVDLGQIRAIQVYISGQARRPGVYTVSALSTLVDALFASGGPSSAGSLRNIQLVRDGKQVSNFDLYDLLAKGDKSKDSKLLSGDVIFIPPVGPQVAITGSVRAERIFEVRRDEPLQDLLRFAGGMSATAAEAHVSIGRVIDHRDMRTIDVKMDTSGLATPLADGDLVHIYSIVPRFTETVTLRGNTANAGRFAWRAGMRVSDLIPDKEALVTRDYWWKRAQLGIPSPEFEPSLAQLQPQQSQQPQSLQFQNGQAELATGARLGMGYDGQVRTQNDFQSQYPSPYQNQYQAQPGAQQRRTDEPHLANSTLASGQALSAQGAAGPEEQEEALPKNQVRLLAPEIDWDYAVVERQDHETLKVQLLPFDLGRLVLQHDSSQDLELQAGDVVTVFSEADIRPPVSRQSKLIKLNGEFVHAGTYTAEPGETLRDLVRRAGGLTADAYLYGAEFRRESTRKIQQAHLDDYVRNLQMQLQHNSMNFAAQQGLANAPSNAGAQNSIISQLNQIRATGRIVLEFTPDRRRADEIPNMALENGDSFTVPSRPSSVNVLGAVNDQNSFIYNPKRRVVDYLGLAGGASRNADSKHAFLIRADGSVVGKEHTSGMWSNSFNDLHLNPGDTLVVPEKLYKPSALKGVLDWSQVFSQFAIGAASLNAIK